MMRANLLSEFRGDEAAVVGTASVANGGVVTARGGSSLLGSLTDASLRFSTGAAVGSQAYVSQSLTFPTAFCISFYLKAVPAFLASATRLVYILSAPVTGAYPRLRIKTSGGLYYYETGMTTGGAANAAVCTPGVVQHLDWICDVAAGTQRLILRSAAGELLADHLNGTTGTGSAPTSLRVGPQYSSDNAESGMVLDVAGVAAYGVAIARGPLRVRRHVRSLAVAGSALNWPNAHGRPELAGAL